MPERHKITIDNHAESRCGTAGHYDTLIECSCGWTNRLSHGSGDTGIVGHRLKVLEAAAGISVAVKGKVPRPMTSPLRARSGSRDEQG